MSMAACYTMDLYCDAERSEAWNSGPHTYGEFPHQFMGETFVECKREAKKNGWMFKADGTHICPKHSGKKPQK